ncbi:MAG: hypothetical protein K2N63_03000 [Lachnospiraceae bacterium]|nr:hypothetical protein [Lachnospiraceae bacterium]
MRYTYLIEWGFWVLLAVIVGLLGNSRREEKRVDPNKTVMRQNPTLRFSMYGVGIILTGLFVFVGTGAVKDGAHREEPFIIPLILLGVLAGILCFMAGYILYKKHVFFDEDGLIVGRPFRGNLQLKWTQISRMEMKGNRLVLYGPEGKKLLKADPSLENFDLFSSMAKRMCSAKQVREGKETWKGGERIMARRGATRVMFGISALLVLSVVILGQIGDYQLSRMFVRSDMVIFPITLAIAAAIFIYGIWLYADRIRYTKEEITFCRLFSKKTFEWRTLKKIRRAKVGQMEVEKLFLTFDGKEYAVSSAKYLQEYSYFLDFIIDVALRQGIATENL